MLVSIQTGYRPRTFLSPPHIASTNVVGAATIGPQLDKVLEPSHVINAQVFGAPEIVTLPPGQLSPSHVVNANVVNPASIVHVTPPITTSYANPKGTGDRRATIVTTSSAGLFATGNLSNLIDGSLTALTAYFGVVSNAWMKFDFGTPRLFDAFRWYQSNAQNHGNWKWQGSSDDASYVDVGAPFLLEGMTGGAAWEIAQPAGNTTKYRYWRMQQVSGGTSGGPYTYEIEFKIDAGP